MSKFFMYGTELQELEQLMMLVPNFIPKRNGVIVVKKVGIMKEPVSCEGCEYPVSNYLNEKTDIFFTERFAAGLICYEDIVKSFYKEFESYQLNRRLNQLINNFDGEIFLNSIHHSRFHTVCRLQNVSFKNRTPIYNATLFLLTADDKLWCAAKEHIYLDCFDFKKMNLNGINTDGYALYQTSRTIFTGREYIKTDEIADETLIGDDVFKAIINATLIAKYGADGVIQNTKIEELFLNLVERLKHTKGKRVYGYLQPNIKAMVDEIVDELSKEKVAKAYELWYEMRNDVLHSYMDTLPEVILLSQQKEFKSIKNMIIAEADKIAKGEVNFVEIDNEETEYADRELSESESFEEIVGAVIGDFEPRPDDMVDEPDFENQNVYVKWTDEYIKAREYLFGTEEVAQDFKKAMELFIAEVENGKALAMFDIGRIYADGLGVEIDTDKAQDYYAKALLGFQKVESNKAWKYTEYRIGKMFDGGLGTDQDYKTAAQWLGLSAEKKYKYAQYSLGGLYYRGLGVQQDFQTAFALYLKSGEQGFPYADFEAAKMYRDGIGTDKDSKESNHHFKKAFSGFENLEKISHDDKIQYRLGWMLQNGIGTEKDIARAKEYFEMSAKLGNTFACYSLAKLILTEDNPLIDEVEKAVAYLKTASDNGNEHAQYSLGKIYLEGKHIPKDTEKAILFLTQSADKNNEWANYKLGKLYLLGKDIPKYTEKAIAYLTKSAEQGNQFAQYVLGKLYMLGKDVPKDKETAIKWFTLSAEQGNEYAKFFLDNMDKFKEPSIALCASRMFQHMSRIFEENMPLNKSMPGPKIDSKLLRKLKAKKVAQGHKKDDIEHSLSL